MGSERFELSTSAMSRGHFLQLKKVSNSELKEYLNTIELSGVTEKHIKEMKRFLENYLNDVEWGLDKNKTIQYFKKLKDNSSVSYYRKQGYQILKFLSHHNQEWASKIKLPSDPVYMPIKVTQEEVDSTLDYFKGKKHELQFKALINLACDSGIRAHELYQLEPLDIDLKDRVVKIEHNPNKNKSTKTKTSRVSFFTEKTAQILKEYFEYFNNGSGLTCLFNQTHIERQFKDAPLRVKDLRKYFSSEWERRNGNHQLKERLLGHSLKSVDARHYSYLDTEEIKAVYDKVMK